ANGIASLVTEAQSAERGYLLTGEETALEPYVKSVTAVAAQINELRRLTEDNPRVQRSLDSFERTFGNARERTKQTTDTRKTKGFDASLADARSGAGQKLADESIAILRGIESDHKDLQRKLDNDATASALAWVRNWTIGGGILTGAF